MSRRLRESLEVMMILSLLFAGCGTQQEVPPELPGKLVGVSYDRTVGMERGSNFSVSIERDKILSMEYFDSEELEYIEVQDVPLEEGIWESVETAVTQMWPTLQEKVPQEKRSRLYWILSGFRDGEPMVLDGGDRTDFSLVWETAEGTVTIPYRWDNSDSQYFELAALLKALAPQ